MEKGFLSNLRAFAAGKLDESALMQTSSKDTYDFEGDAEFMQECMTACAPMILQSMIMDESAEAMDEATKDAFLKVQSYMVGQGLISEASAPAINPKLNVVHLNKQAQLHRLSTILTLKMARKAKSKNFTKYKIGQKIKKTNMEEMRKRYGAQADRLAKKLYEQLKKNAKATAVVAEKKKTVK